MNSKAYHTLDNSALSRLPGKLVAPTTVTFLGISIDIKDLLDIMNENINLIFLSSID